MYKVLWLELVALVGVCVREHSVRHNRRKRPPTRPETRPSRRSNPAVPLSAGASNASGSRTEFASSWTKQQLVSTCTTELLCHQKWHGAKVEATRHRAISRPPTGSSTTACRRGAREVEEGETDRAGNTRRVQRHPLRGHAPPAAPR